MFFFFFSFYLVNSRWRTCITLTRLQATRKTIINMYKYKLPLSKLRVFELYIKSFLVFIRFRVRFPCTRDIIGLFLRPQVEIIINVGIGQNPSSKPLIQIYIWITIITKITVIRYPVTPRNLERPRTSTFPHPTAHFNCCSRFL